MAYLFARVSYFPWKTIDAFFVRIDVFRYFYSASVADFRYTILRNLKETAKRYINIFFRVPSFYFQRHFANVTLDFSNFRLAIRCLMTRDDKFSTTIQRYISLLLHNIV